MPVKPKTALLSYGEAPASGLFFQLLGLGFSVLTPAGQLLHANAAVMELLGYSLEELQDKTLRSLVHPADAHLEDVLQRRLRQGHLDSYRIPLRMICKDGRIVRVDTSVMGIVHGGERPALVARYLSPAAGESQPPAKGLPGAPSDADGQTPPFSPWEPQADAQEDGLLRQLSLEVLRRTRAERFESAAYLATRAMLTGADLPEILEEMHRAVLAVIPASHFVVGFWSESGDTLSYPYISQDAAAAIPPEFLERLAHLALQNNRPMLMEGAMLREAAARIGLAAPGVRSWLGVPLYGRGSRIQGFMACFSSQEGRFVKEDLSVAEVFAQFIGWAVERHVTDTAIRLNEVRFRSIFSCAAAGIVLLDLMGQVQDMNPAGQAILGHNLEEVRGKLLEDFSEPQGAGNRETLAELTAGKREAMEEIRRFLRKDGTHVWCRETITLVRDDQGHPWFAIAMMEDITEHRKADDKLVHQAFHDQLTGLPNRTLFMDRLEAAMRRGKGGGDQRVAVLFLDLNRFKVVNDSLGHGAGDLLLQEIAKRLSSCLRDSDTLARFGGDEFALLILGVGNLKETGRVIGRIQQRLREPVMIDGHEIFAGASIGVVLGACDYERAGDVIRDADIAMYRAKESVRPGYAIFDTTMHEQVKGILRTETDLRKALDRGEFELCYQPIINLEDGRITGLEALIRWNHPQRGLVKPGEFIPLAEEAGLIFEIDRWALAWGCSAMSLWQEKHPRARDLTLSVNLSSKYFLKKDAVDDLAAIISLTGFNPRALKLEITENLILDADEHTKGKLISFKEMGLSLALDDFGTGYSSLGYLRRFPFDELKIDRSFVQNMLHDPDDSAIVESILGLGRTLCLDVVAEGVETDQQVQMLRSFGCKLVQGYHFYRPLTAAQVEELFGDR